MHRSVGVALALTLLLAACGGDGDTGPNEGGQPPSTVEPGRPVPVRVIGAIEETDEGWLLCPGAVAPCWPVVDEPDAGTRSGSVVATGTWDRDTIDLDTVEPGPGEGSGLTNPCLEEGHQPDEAWQDDEAFDDYVESIPEQVAGVWLADDVLVMAVTDDVEGHRAALDDRGIQGVCVADLGFEHTLAELDSTLEEMSQRWPSWADEGWVVLSGSVDVAENRVVVAFDEIDQGLRDEIETTWGDRVEIRANVEVLDGPVEQLELPPADNAITVATQPRGSGGMDALGRFTLRFDAGRGCLYLEASDGSRTKPIWPFGYRALPDPVRVVDGRGEVVAVVDQQLELGGGSGQVLPDSDDPTDCGATTVWVINPT